MGSKILYMLPALGLALLGRVRAHVWVNGESGAGGGEGVAGGEMRGGGGVGGGRCVVVCAPSVGFPDAAIR